MALHTAPSPGFPQMTDTGDKILLTCTCTSAAAVTAAGGVIEGDDAGLETYTSAGILLADPLNPTNYDLSLNFESVLTTAQKAEMERGFTLTVWIESEFFATTYSPAGQEYLLGAYNSAFFGVNKKAGINDLFLRNANGAGFSASNVDHENIGKGTHTRVDLSKIGGKTTVYVNYLPQIQFDDGALTATPFNAFIGIGASQFGDAPAIHRLKDFMITMGSISIPSISTVYHMAAVGMSFGTGGDYYSFNPYLGGDTAGGTEPGTLPTIHRSLGGRDINIPRGYIRNYSVGGTFVASGANDMATQVTAALANSTLLDNVIIQFGANECAYSTNSFDSDYGPVAPAQYDFEAEYQTQLDRLIAAGARTILIYNTASLANEAAKNIPIYAQRVDDCNVMLDSLVAANSQCYLVDAFSTLGGDSPDSDCFAADNIHPNSTGYNKLGDAGSAVLLPIIDPNFSSGGGISVRVVP